jgi:hypothetical protein
MNRCRYCGIRGHNIVTCPKIKEAAAANPDSWAARRVNQIKSKNEPANRQCKYCGETGHNKRTCKKILENTIEAVNINTQYRKAVLAYYKKYGIGVGTLVQTKRTAGYDLQKNYNHLENPLAMIVEIKTENIIYPGSRNDDIIFEFTNVYDWDGRNGRRSGYIPVEYIAEDKDLTDPTVITNSDYSYGPLAPFKVVGPGYFMIDDEEAFCKDATPFKDIMSMMGTDYDCKNRFKNRKYFK